MAAAPAPRRWRWRSLLWITPLLLVVFVVVSDIFGWAYLRQPVAKLLSARLDRQVAIGPPFRIHLRPTVPIRIGSVFVAAPQWSDAPHLVDIENIEAELRWDVILGRQPRLPRLAIAKADIHAVRDEEGRATWSFGPKADESAEPSEPVIPAIEQLEIGEATVHVDDALTDLQMQIVATTSEGQGGSGLVVDGKGSWKDDPMGFELRTAGLLPALEGSAPIDVDLKGRLKSTELTFDGTVSDLGQFQRVAGAVSVKGSSLADLTAIPGLTLPSTPPFTLDGDIARDGATVKAIIHRAEIGSSRMKANLEYDGAGSPPVLRGSLDASRLVLQDLGPSIGAEPDTAPTISSDKKDASAAKPARKDASAGPSRVLPTKEFDLPSLRAMNADVAIDLNRLDLGTDALRPLQSLKARLLLDGGVLKLQDLTSSLAGGTVTGSTALDGSTEDRVPTFDARLTWKRVSLEKWLKVGDGGYFVAGRFNGQTILAGGGRSTAQILDSLNGTVKGNIDGGSISHQIVELAGLDVAQSIGVFLGGDQPLSLTCALVDLAANKGTIKSNLFLLNTKDTIFFLLGSVDLRNERLNLRLVQSPKDWSPLSLRSPITIDGTFADPAIGLAPAPIALKVFSGIVLGAVTPLAALLPFIELGGESTRQGCEPAIEQVKSAASEFKSDGAGAASAGEGSPAGGAPADGNGPLRQPGRLPGSRP